MKGKLIKVKTGQNLNDKYINLDNVVSINIYDTMISMQLADGMYLHKACDSELEAQMIFAKLKNYFGFNEELSELLNNIVCNRNF